MTEINIRRPHALTLEAARSLAEDIASRLHQRFDLAYRWEGDALHFEREGVLGALTVADGEIQIQARLGFLLSLAKPHIEQEIHASLDEMLDRRHARTGKASKRAHKS
jgi:putative polyhydroxyalkanoate system protein